MDSKNVKWVLKMYGEQRTPLLIIFKRAVQYDKDFLLTATTYGAGRMGAIITMRHGLELFL